MLPPAPEPVGHGPNVAHGPKVAASFPPAVVRPPQHRSGALPRGASPLEPRFDELPSLNPFAGFVAPPPSFIERWAVVLLVAMALVGAAALAAIALGYLGAPGG